MKFFLYLVAAAFFATVLFYAAYAWQVGGPYFIYRIIHGEDAAFLKSNPWATKAMLPFCKADQIVLSDEPAKTAGIYFPDGIGCDIDCKAYLLQDKYSFIEMPSYRQWEPGSYAAVRESEPELFRFQLVSRSSANCVEDLADSPPLNDAARRGLNAGDLCLGAFKIDAPTADYMLREQKVSLADVVNGGEVYRYGLELVRRRDNAVHAQANGFIVDRRYDRMLCAAPSSRQLINAALRPVENLYTDGGLE